MDIPPCFNNMTYAFNQYFFIMYKTMEDVLEAAVTIVPPSERAELSAYLDRLLAAGPEVCDDVWNRSATAVFVQPVEALVDLLRDIRAWL